MRRLLRLWGPVAIWLGAIFLASSRSVPGPVSRVPDWISHGAIYAIASFLTCRALAGGLGARLGAAGTICAILGMTAFGVSDEWHQSFVPGRDASPGDVLKDLGGAVVGASVFARWGWRQTHLIRPGKGPAL